MKYKKYQISKNPNLTNWKHGDKADPVKWPWWKLFHIEFLDIAKANKWNSTEHRLKYYYRLYIYTKKFAHNWDFVREK